MGGNYCPRTGGNKLSTIPKNHWVTIDLDSIFYIKYYIVLYVIKLEEKIGFELERHAIVMFGWIVAVLHRAYLYHHNII